MSVDGRTAPVMISVRQLVEVFPARCLVRKTISAMTTDDVRRGGGTRSRRIDRGELLSLVNVTAQQRLLLCRDEKGSDVYLTLDQRGLFSAVNGHTAANVYTLRSLLAEFRLPIIVRLVCGSLPIHDATAGDLRLVGIQTDSVTFVVPLRHAWTSRSVDRRALVAVPSRHASRLTIKAAAKDFYCHWVESDDGQQLMRRCTDIVASWNVSVHVVPSAIAAAAAVAASTAGSRRYEGDDATWSRGPMGSSLDSGLASSASSPSFICTGEALDNDNDEDVGHLEQEIDDIYATIRYGGDAVARGRARSLDDLNGYEVFPHKPTLDAYCARQTSANALCTSQMPTTIVTCTVRRKGPDNVVDVGRLLTPVIGKARQSSAQASVDNVKLVGMSSRPENETDDVNKNVLSVGRDSEDVDTACFDHPPEAHAVVAEQPDTEAAVSRDEHASTTPKPQRPRSKSFPEIRVVAPEARDRKAHKSLIGTFTRSIANVFRRIRPHKASHVFTLDTAFTTVTNERYRRKTFDLCNETDVDGIMSRDVVLTKGPFIATQLNSTQLDVELSTRSQHEQLAYQ